MKLRARILLLVLVILLAACRDGAVAASPAPLFPRQKDEPSEMMLALFSGELTVVDDCLRAIDSDGNSVLPIWPHDFSLYVKGNAVQILDGDGYLVAQVGDQLGIGGGEIPIWFARTRVDSTTQLILDACPGPYWLVGQVN
jgi:hypothetical protein